MPASPLPTTAVEDVWGEQLNEAIRTRSTPEFIGENLPARLGEAALSATFAQRNGRVWVLGDSNSASQISAAGGQADTGQPGLQFGRDGWVTNAVLSSKALWTLAGIFATGGYSAKQILDQYVSLVIARGRPGDSVVVFAGTNGNSHTDTIAIHDTLRTQGFNTIAVLVPPSTAAGVNLVTSFNDRIRDYAIARQIPIVDTYSALVDRTTGTIQAALNADGVHPNAAGYRVLGEAFSLVLNELFKGSPDPLVKINAPLTAFKVSKPLALDNPVDGPDFGRHSASGTVTVVDDPAFVGGKAYKFTQTDVATAFVARLSLFTLETGKTYRFGLAFDADPGVAPGNWQISLEANGINYSLFAMTVNGGFVNYAAKGKFYLDIKIPPTAPAGANYRFKVSITNGGGTVKVGQVTAQQLD